VIVDCSKGIYVLIYLRFGFSSFSPLSSSFPLLPYEYSFIYWLPLQAINEILDQAINVDAEEAPEHLRLHLLKENPMWKLPEKRVARYLKRHLKARESPQAEEIDADLDEQTVFTTLSTATATKESANIPGIAKNESIPENATEETTPVVVNDSNDDVGTEGTDDNTEEEADKVEPDDTTTQKEEDKDENTQEKEQVPASCDDDDVSELKVDAAVAVDQEETTAVPRDVSEIYVDDNDGESDKNCECFGICVIS